MGNSDFKRDDAGVLWVRRTYPTREGNPEIDGFYEERYPLAQKFEDAVPVMFESPEHGLARAKVGLGMTLKIRDYESARVDVGIELPCQPSEIKEAFGIAWEIVEAELRTQIRRERELGRGTLKGKD